MQDCRPPPVCNCGEAVSAVGEPLRHQDFDIPPVRAQVQEYRLYSGVLGSGFDVTQFKMRNLLAQMMGLDFSLGAIAQAHGKVAQALQAPVAEAVRSLAIDAPVVYMHETRNPREGSAIWVWGAVQPKLAVFSVLPSRARYAAQDLLGPAPKGVLESDRYAVYAFVGAEQRQVCWAHLLRDFTRIAQRQGAARTIGRRLLGLGLLMFGWRHRGMTSTEQFEPLSRRLRQALQDGVAQALRTIVL